MFEFLHASVSASMLNAVRLL